MISWEIIYGPGYYGRPEVMNGPDYEKLEIVNRPDYGYPGTINGPCCEI